MKDFESWFDDNINLKSYAKAFKKETEIYKTCKMAWDFKESEKIEERVNWYARVNQLKGTIKLLLEGY